MLLGTMLTAQSNPFADSLLRVLPLAKDTQRVNILNDLGWEFKVDQPETARQYLRESAALARRLGFQKGEAQAYSNLGVVETINEVYDSARVHYHTAMVIRDKLDDRKGVAKLHNNLGNLESDLKNFEAAIGHLRQSVIIQEELGDSFRMARSAYNLAIVYEDQGYYPEALENALLHLQVSEQLNDPYEIANSNNLLGNIKTELGNYTEAGEHYQKSYEYRKQVDDPWELANILNNMGNNKDDFGEKELKAKNFEEAFVLMDEALSYYRQSLLIYQEQEDSSGMAEAFNNIGLVHKNLGDYYDDQDQIQQKDSVLLVAMEYLEASLHINEVLENRKGVMQLYNGIADVKRRQGDSEGSLKFTKKYLKLAKKLDDIKYEVKAYKDLSRVYADMKDYKNAFKYRKKYDELNEDVYNEENSKRIAYSQVIYTDEKFRMQKQRELEAQAASIREARLQRRMLIVGLLALLLIAVLLYNRYRTKNRINQELQEKNEQIKAAQDRSDELLKNILPAATAEELKKTGKAKARQFESVTVLFTDFKSFTQIAEQLEPEMLVEQLHYCFSAFDRIVKKHGVEKIKTIGDAYMCVGGLPEPNKTHARDVVAAALDILDFMHAFNAECSAKGLPIFQTRLGIHTGSVVSGIVGQEKFAYDIWGDTVNLASRMESSGEIGKINISAATYAQVKEQFACTYRGKVGAKNKGELDMYFVDRKREEIFSREAADKKKQTFTE